MKPKGMIFLIVLLWWSLFLNAGAYTFSGYLPRVEKAGSDLVIKINTLKMEKDFYIYYRTEGLKNYQVRKMKIDKEGNVYYQLATKNLYGKSLEYFIVENNTGASRSISPVFTITEVTDKASPEIYFLDAGQGSEGGAPKIGLPVKIAADLATNTYIHDSNGPPDNKFDATGNIRLYRNISEEKYEFDFDTSIAYMKNPSETESHFNLSNMKVRFKAGNHTFAVGDLSISNSEFTGSVSQRGLHYIMEGKALYFSSFITNAQQKTGFEGFGIPDADANIFGATAGVNIGTFRARGMFMSGKDNLDSKTVVSSGDAYKAGNVFAFWGELSLFNSQLNLNGEFASSSFGSGADSDSIEKERDTAWLANANFRRGIFNAQVDYKKVGSKFGSVANLFLVGAEEGLNSSIGLNIKSVSLTLGYGDKKTNIDSEILPMQRSKDLSANLNCPINSHFNLGAEFSLNNLDYDKSTGLETGSEDMDTIKYSGILGYAAGRNSITVSLGKTESKNFSSDIDGSVALNLKLGNFLSLNPSLSYQSREDLTYDSTTKNYTATLNGELTFIPGIFSLSFESSWFKSDNTVSDSTTLTVRGNLNLFMSKLFNDKLNPSLSLRGKYEESKYGDTSSTSTSLYLDANISF
jgi:hypothetical protein